MMLPWLSNSLDFRSDTSYGYESEQSAATEEEILRLKRDLDEAYGLLAGKDKEIEKLKGVRKAADKEIVEITEALFQVISFSLI